MDFFDLILSKEELPHEDLKIKEEPKIMNTLVGCDIDKYIKGTIKYKPEEINKLIKDINNSDNNQHKRLFYKNNGNIGYIEVFQNGKLAFAYKISNKISFLFECNSNNINITNNKCFGFRYYNSKNEYCSLLKIGDNDKDEFKFLEKINEKENYFYDEKLDCFEIVYESIFSRFENGYNIYSTLIEGPLYEILGFSYGIIYKSNTYFKFYRPYSIDIMNINDFTSNIPIEDDYKKLNIMPILFDGHISILFFVDNDKKRGYILSDPSHTHSKKIYNTNFVDGFLFPKNMRKNMKIYPKKRIQKFNSCSLWYYFQMLILINYNKNNQKEYKTSIDLIKSIINSSLYFECVNYYQELVGCKKKLIEINPNLEQLDEDYIYFIPKSKYASLDKVRIYKYSFMNQFVDLIELFESRDEQMISYQFGFEELKVFQNYYEDFIDFILLLNYNLNFLHLNKAKDDNNDVIKMYESTLVKMDQFKKSFINFCLNYFSEFSEYYKKNRYFSENKSNLMFYLMNKIKV